MLTDEISYKLLKALEQDPQMSQRELSKSLGISLGKTNFCIQALLKVGWIKANNFKNSKNKMAYSYLLTAKGMDEKLNVTKRFLKKKIKEYEALEQEIASVRADLQNNK